MSRPEYKPPQKVYEYKEDEVRLVIYKLGASLEFLVPDEYAGDYSFPVKEIPKLIEALKKVESL